ncbi:hypothetical protein [Parasitella parasitica]|uniref:Cas12f1-like TNB domain-containing protein n=1 Tax=Parasitella parasitica TaxID=35722 RepID=A0A0B7NJV7_9FUNG|nr:hypothetical protein [Parasitella parasitica]
MQIDQQAFWRIVSSCGKTNQEIKDSIPEEKNDETLRSCYSQIFDFSKLSFKNKQDLSNDKRLFWHLMQTNGYSVEFTFKKKPTKKSASKPLTAADFCEDIKNDQVLNWGVDTGVTDIYTAADSGDASKKERIRKQRILSYSNKYNKDSSIGEKKQTSTTDKWIPSPPKDKTTDSSVKTRVFAYGNASFGTSMKCKLPAPTKRITEAVKKLSKDSKGTYFIYVDEYLTSQTCNKCKQRKLTNLNNAESKRKVHVVLKCNSCNTLWNRDVMASKSIYCMMHYMSQHNNERSPKSARPSDTSESIPCMRSP